MKKKNKHLRISNPNNTKTTPRTFSSNIYLWFLPFMNNFQSASLNYYFVISNSNFHFFLVGETKLRRKLSGQRDSIKYSF